jgi:hypothetical protein
LNLKSFLGHRHLIVVEDVGYRLFDILSGGAFCGPSTAEHGFRHTPSRQSNFAPHGPANGWRSINSDGDPLRVPEAETPEDMAASLAAKYIAGLRVQCAA